MPCQKGKNGPIPLFPKIISNIPLFQKYVGIYLKLEFQKLKLFEKINFKFVENFLWNSSSIKNFQNFFIEFKYHQKLDFLKVEYPKMVDPYIFSIYYANRAFRLLHIYFSQWVDGRGQNRNDFLISETEIGAKSIKESK